MKVWAKAVLAVVVLLLLPLGIFAEKEEGLLVPLYTGSWIRSNDLFGFEELSFVLNESTVSVQEGYLRRIFCQAPEGRSPLEIIKNYEKTIRDEGGEILFVTRRPQEIKIDEISFEDLFREVRKDPGLSTQVFSQTSFPGNITEYLVGKLAASEKDIYVIVAAGLGAWAASEDSLAFFELVFLEVEAMEMGMISAAGIAIGLETQGKIAIYELLFDTGKSEIKPESASALQAIADYLNTHKNQKVFVVGHTDNIGDFDFNLDLSRKRADAVIAKLISEYGVKSEQMKAFGAGPVAPVASNATEEGRAKNRRVEIVAQ